jgi:hypothetical protein
LAQARKVDVILVTERPQLVSSVPGNGLPLEQKFPAVDQRCGFPAASKTAIPRYPSSFTSKIRSGESNGSFTLSAIIGEMKLGKSFCGVRANLDAGTGIANSR